MRILGDSEYWLTSEKAWLGFNILGLGAYLIIELWLLAPRIEEEAIGGLEQHFFWLHSELLLCAFYMGGNSTWLLMRRTSASFRSRDFPIAILLVIAWGAVVIFDPLAVNIICTAIALVADRAQLF